VNALPVLVPFQPVPPPGLCCPVCRSRRVTVTRLKFGGLDIKVLHLSHCRTRRNVALRHRTDLHIWDWLVNEGAFVPHYNADPPKHRYLVMA
jgi:hypothetical protein